MDILARFLLVFGSAFMGIGVVMMSFLRKQIKVDLKKKQKKKRSSALHPSKFLKR
jgi:preprotein translocase subunit SecG